MTEEASSSASYVFLSYASANRARALEVADALVATGVAVWIDRKGIAPGTSWSAEIVRAIDGCSVFVVLCSQASMTSPNVGQEIQLAWESRRPILPIRIEAVQLPETVRYALAGRQWIDVLDRPTDAWLADVLRGLDAVRQALPASGPVSPPSNGADAQIRLIPASSPGSGSGLPPQATPFIGREREVKEVGRLLRQSGVRLVTVTGPGGIGKTRLILRAAEMASASFPDGVFFVRLAAIRNPTLVIPAIAEAFGVKETGSRPLIDTLKDRLRDKVCLLVLDNFEQVLPAAPSIADLLSGCPGVKCAVTSRSSLRVYGEHEYVLDSLQLPDPAADHPLKQLARNEAVRLFVERARAVRSDFALTQDNAAAIVEICRRLDGLPLAIELAAARVRVFSPAALLERLDQRLTFLTDGAVDRPDRQKTLNNTIAWSYDLLGEAERGLFRRLCVFVGGFDLPAASQVYRASEGPPIELEDALDSLVGQSLLRSEDVDGEPWFVMLETIREYGLDRLEEQGESDAARNAHASYFLSLVYAQTTGQLGANNVLARNHGNVMSALDHFIDTADWQRALQLCYTLSRFWRSHNYLRAARSDLERALALAATAEAAETKGALALRALALTGLVGILSDLSELDVARKRSDEALDLARRSSNRKAVVVALFYAGLALLRLGEFGPAAVLANEMLTLSRGAGELLAADGIDARSSELTSTSSALGLLGIIAGEEGRPRESRTYLEESVPLQQQLTVRPMEEYLLAYLGFASVDLGDLDRAQRELDQALALCQQMGYQYHLPYVLVGYVGLIIARGGDDRGVRLAGTIVSAFERTAGFPFQPWRRKRLDRYLAPARTRLTPDEFRRAWSEGQTRMMDEAAREALRREEVARPLVGQPAGPEEKT